MEQLGSQLEEQADKPPVAAAVPLADDGFVDFVLAGTRAAGEFRCADCGYGAVIQRVLPTCPMCSGTIWESRRASRQRLLD